MSTKETLPLPEFLEMCAKELAEIDSLKKRIVENGVVIRAGELEIERLRTRLNAAEKELANRAISNYRAEQTKQVDEIIRDQISRVKVLESTFRHVHVSNSVNDLCKQCGLDLRDPIHERF